MFIRITMSNLCVFSHTFYAAVFLIRENLWFPWLQNDPRANCLRCDKSQNSEPRNTRNFTDETAPHTVSVLTRKPHRHLPLCACCDFAFFFVLRSVFFVLLCPVFVFFRARFMRPFFLSVKFRITMSRLCAFPHTFYTAIFLFSVKFRVFRGHKCRVHAALSKLRSTRNFTEKTAPRPSKPGCG